MVGSIWRYSHFLLAAISSLFLLLASITGAILAIEPIDQASKSYHINDLDEISLSQAISHLKEQYDEVLELEVTANEFVKVSIFTKEGNNETIYVDPFTGKKLGDVVPQSPFFSYVTNLHRSLFLKTIGRAFVGIISLLLCFIAITGIFLLAQRQGGFKKWFTKVHEKNFNQRYHVILGRWFFLPILIIAVTGVYLSAEKFDLLPSSTIIHQEYTIDDTTDFNAQGTLPLFENTALSEVRKVLFPFSEFPEDPYEVSLEDRELIVHQYTGEVLSEVPYPFIQLASRLSLKWHTGQGSILWAIMLLIASISILFFIYSGLALWLKRQKKSKSIDIKWPKDQSEYIILVGSEGGETQVFANALFKALDILGKRVFMTTLNAYEAYSKAQFILILTSTYGDGDAPSGARKFKEQFKKIKQTNTIHYAILGFGSTSYPKYCKYAEDVEALLSNESQFYEFLPTHKINEQSIPAFKDWIQEFNTSSGLNLQPVLKQGNRKPLKKHTFTVVEKTQLNCDDTLLIRLKPKKRIKFQSGDLLNVLPPQDQKVRQYSIARTNNDVLLSIKKHSLGKCSTYLSQLQINDTFQASITHNKEFHFPQEASSVWLIANGTGIAPYLGMLESPNVKNIQLTWGGRTQHSFELYQKYIDKALTQKRLSHYELALSQQNNKWYVQDSLAQKKEKISAFLEDGGVFMLCGSVAMQNGVLEILENICVLKLKKSLTHFENNGQLLMDCY